LHLYLSTGSVCTKGLISQMVPGSLNIVVYVCYLVPCYLAVHMVVQLIGSCVQAMSGQLSDKDVSDKDMTDSANATYSRIRLLQDHLCTYAERNVPVVSINFSNFSDTLDQLHDYLLQCIESAMAQQH